MARLGASEQREGREQAETPQQAWDAPTAAGARYEGKSAEP